MKKVTLKILLLGAALGLAGTSTLTQFVPAKQTPTKLVDPTKKAQEDFESYSKLGDIDFNYGWKLRNWKDGNLKQEVEDSKPYGINFDDESWSSVDLPNDFAIEGDFEPDVGSELGHKLGGFGWYRKHFYLPEELSGKHITITFDGIYMNSRVFINGELLGNYPSGYEPITYDLTPHLNFGADKENVIAVFADNSSNGTSRWYSGAGIFRNVTFKVQEENHIIKNGVTITLPDLKKNYEARKDDKADFTATASVATIVKNDSDSDGDISVTSTLVDYKTHDAIAGVESVTSSKSVTKGSEVTFENNVVAKNPKLWSDKTPNLYAIKTEVKQGDKVLETRYDRFGFRYFDWYSENEAEAREDIHGAGFYLNGVYTRFNGVCMHHDQGALGAVANHDAMLRQMQVMKDMGVNALRITHNVADPYLIQIADELGLLTMPEWFDEWYDHKAWDGYANYFEKQATHPDAKEGQTWAEFDMEQVIKRERNSPAIVMWSVGNEIPSLKSNTEKALQTIQNLQNWAHKYDVFPEDDTRATGQRRFVGIGQNPASASTTYYMDHLDSVGYNYWYQWPREKQKNYRLFGSENASAVGSRGFYKNGYENRNGYTYMDNVGLQLSSWDNSAVPWGSTASFELKRQQELSYITGEFVWTGFDYIGEPTPWYATTGKNSKASYFGIVDTAGFAKDDYFLYQSQWVKLEDKPIVHIVGHWNWEDDNLRNQMLNSDGTFPVKVYTNARSVELFKQEPGKEAVSLGQKSFIDYPVKHEDETLHYQRTDEDVETKDDSSGMSFGKGQLFLQWNLPADTWSYEPGTKIYAVAKDKDGKIVKNSTDFLTNLNRPNDTLVTAGKIDKVKLEVEKREMTADGYDLIYIDAKGVDKDGNFTPNAMNALNFKYIGDNDVAEIVGVDNGDASSWERFKDYDGTWKRSLFNGRALIIVKAKHKAGSFSIQATSNGIKGDTVTVISKGNEGQSDANLISNRQEIAVIPSTKENA